MGCGRGGRKRVSIALGKAPRLAPACAGGGYAGNLLEWTARIALWAMEIVRRSGGIKGFNLLPRRWMVVRTLGWLGRYRRLREDYRVRPPAVEGGSYLAALKPIVRQPRPDWQGFSKMP